ncbi:hypothetical protein J2769_000365 [Acinetobacter guillouiae]|nr:hypothetical protein [Acinetobacter guillouiae]
MIWMVDIFIALSNNFLSGICLKRGFVYLIFIGNLLFLLFIARYSSDRPLRVGST